jgi:hypothetical protein
MGILRKGIFGGFEQKTGPLVGRRLKGENVISATPHKSTKRRSLSQLDQQLKLGLVVSSLKWFNELIAFGFKNVKGKGTAFNAAVKYNFERILTGVAPDYAIDYSKLVYSKGSLAEPNCPGLVIVDELLKISWLPSVQTRFNQNTDKASFLVCCPEHNLIIKKIGVVIRSVLGYDITLPPGLAGERLYCFMNFVSADGKVVSNSVYLKTI